jgi:hypothetical protein
MLSVRIGDHCYYGLCDMGASISATRPMPARCCGIEKKVRDNIFLLFKNYVEKNYTENLLGISTNSGVPVRCYGRLT